MQRAYTKRLSGLQNLFYKERLTKLKMQSLAHRRFLSDLVVCYNIIHGLSALQFNDFFKFSNTSRTRGHNLRLETPLIKTIPGETSLLTELSNLGMLSQPPLLIPIPRNLSKDKYLISTYHYT